MPVQLLAAVLLLTVCPAEANVAQLAESLKDSLSEFSLLQLETCASVASANLATKSQGLLQLTLTLQNCHVGARMHGDSVSQSPLFGFQGNKNDTGETRPESTGSITFKQSVVFAACGAIIAAFFMVAAVMRFRNRLKKKLRKRRQMEKELQSLRKKSIECRMNDAAAAARPHQSNAEHPFFIVDYASLDNVQELDATSMSGDSDRASLSQSEEFSQSAAIGMQGGTGAASGTVDSHSRATLASPECTSSISAGSDACTSQAHPQQPQQLPTQPSESSDEFNKTPATAAAAVSTAAVAFRRRPSSASTRPPLRKSFSYQAGVPFSVFRQQQQQQQQHQSQQPNFVPSRQSHQVHRNNLLLHIHQQQQQQQQQQQHMRLLAEVGDLERHFQDRREQNRQLHQLRRASSTNANRAAAAAAAASAVAAAGRNRSIGGGGLLTGRQPGRGAARYMRSNSLAPVSSSTMAAW